MYYFSQKQFIGENNTIIVHFAIELWITVEHLCRARIILKLLYFNVDAYQCRCCCMLTYQAWTGTYHYQNNYWYEMFPRLLRHKGKSINMLMPKMTEYRSSCRAFLVDVLQDWTSWQCNKRKLHCDWGWSILSWTLHEECKTTQYTWEQVKFFLHPFLWQVVALSCCCWYWDNVLLDAVAVILVLASCSLGMSFSHGWLTKTALLKNVRPNPDQ